MPHHFTKSTVQATFWCKPCGGDTLHRVDDGRRGACLVCLAKLDEEAEKRKGRKDEPPAAVQLGMFGGEANSGQ